ncbi:MAG: DUF1834 family protein [Desulfuromonadales bacterium]|nr:DUF1834 family protein [Desulfuromonadales bacterium]
MLTQSSDLILQQLKSIDGLKTVKEYVGDPEALLKKPAKLPGAFLVYGGASYKPDPVALASDGAAAKQSWTVILLSKNLRSETEGALECYAYLEQIRAALTKFSVGDGWLWPLKDELLLAEKGALAYGLDFILETEV